MAATSAAEKDEVLTQFIGVTGADRDRASFFLESSGWKLEVALESFYDNSDDMVTNPPSADPPSERQPEPPRVEPPPAAQPQGGSTAKGSAAPKARGGGSSRVATLGDYTSRKADNDSDEEGQAFYAGGADHGSGQQVVGPKKKKVEADSLVKNIFKHAKDHGAEEVAAGGGPSASQPRNASRAFKGAGYRLGESAEEPVVPVPGTSGTMPGATPQETHVVLKMWKTGFSINDGDLRRYEVPENDAFLKTIMKGEIPNELLQLGKGGEVSLDLEDHRNEEFTQPKKTVKAFTGRGVMLGSPTPTMTTGGASTQPSGTPSQSSSAAPAASIDVDPSQPTTTLQLRLADGTRLTGKFNHSHTIEDIRNFIIASRPQYSGQAFVLLTTFPNNTLSDNSQTIEGAKLMNAVIVQRLT
nr:NSFL1 cofactor p47-like [Lytechinus pictus]